MKDHIVFDLETQHEFSEVGGRDYPHLLKVSVVGCYSYVQDKFFTFEEAEIPAFEAMLKNAGLVIGFNTKYFDYAVIQPYLKEVVIKTLPACDLMEDVTNVLGHRLSLDSIAQATLGTQKSGHGLDAIRYFREGNMKKLKSYCLDDVRITRDIFEYGKEHGNVKYSSKYSPDLNSVPVDWKQYISPAGEPVSASASLSSEKDAPSVNRETGNYSLF
ncbi:ribonuclease H-like domain-containing protein [Candidatus Azambacteria bacterium]|nr:ribonuclease H-like domain-containing protein [Candidatus Azambacteria bacterium]